MPRTEPDLVATTREYAKLHCQRTRLKLYLRCWLYDHAYTRDYMKRKVILRY